tara:strand:- start:360 stop:833 length:474 start_codon:yes stop_codon:yes gene_type:complete
MSVKILTLSTVKNRINSLTVSGSHATHLEILHSIRALLQKDGNSEALRLYVQAMKVGMVGKPDGLTFKTLAGYITELGGVLGQGKNDTLTLSGLNKSTVFNPEFFKAHAKAKVDKTPAQKFEAMVSRLLNATDDPMTKEQMRAVITKTVIKSEKKAA